MAGRRDGEIGASEAARRICESRASAIERTRASAGVSLSPNPAIPPSAVRARARALFPLALSSGMVACATASSAVAPAGPQAGRIASLWWVTIAVLSVIYLIVIAVLLLAARRRRLAPADDPWMQPDADRRLARTVGIATAVTAVILLGFLVADVSTGRALETLAERPNPVHIRLIGHQWWWEVRYEGTDPTQRFSTANEIHIPVGRPVSILLQSTDVIHSLWVPQLHGKKDLIPGYTNNIWIQADTPGIYRGQCAEFCGLQHAHMALLVVAEPQTEYLAWMAQQKDTAAAPRTPEQQRGKEVFMNGPCVLCHAIQGTDAGSNNGPDLTHVASRLTLGAGTLPNNVGGMMGWIVDPHASKPGNYMPGNAFSPQDLQALVAYLRNLR